MSTQPHTFAVLVDSQIHEGGFSKPRDGSEFGHSTYDGDNSVFVTLLKETLT